MRMENHKGLEIEDDKLETHVDRVINKWKR